MAFAQQMAETEDRLEEMGHEPLLPKSIEQYIDGKTKNEAPKDKKEKDLIRRHYDKIKKSDAVLFLNYDKNGIENYIGGNSLMELGFAHVLDKKIYLLNPIPEMRYSDEIEAVEPIVLDGNIDKIN